MNHLRKTCRAGSPCSILLIEDDLAVAAMLRESAKRYEPGCFNVEHALTLEQMAAKLAGINYDLVILDLGLTASSGIATLRLARDIINGRAPVAVLTGADDEDLEIRCFEEGAVAYVVKPIVSSNQFLRRCRGWILKHRRDTEMRDLLLRERNDLQEAQRVLIEVCRACGVNAATPSLQERVSNSARVAQTMNQIAEQLYAAAKSIETKYARQIGQS